MDTNTQLKADTAKLMADVQQIAGEVRVKIHLAGMELKDEWNKLEPTLLKVEDAASDFSESTKKAVTDAVEKLTKIKKSLS